MNKDHDLDPVLQRNGQLMGSPLSFPILCAANLLAYWCSLEEYSGRTFGVEELPVIINGDDILFRADDVFYMIWKRWVRVVGFELSLGKNYIHKELLTINSQFYVYKSGIDQFKKLGYMNPGLLTGQSKITGRKTASVAPIWDYYNETISGAVDPERAHRRFMHYHKGTIKQLTRSGTYSLGLPFQRGGLGFRLPFGSGYLTHFQRRFASFLERETELSVSEGKVPRHLLGIVREAKAPVNTIMKKAHPNLLLHPLYGPLQENKVDYVSPTLSYPLFHLSILETEEIRFKVLTPRARVLKRFRESISGQMSNEEIYEWPWRLVMGKWVQFPPRY
jgi:hypothetical protein